MNEEHNNWDLILPFVSDAPEFARGFEAGMFYERCKREDNFVATVHAQNWDQLVLIVGRAGLKIEQTSPQIVDGWIEIAVSKSLEVEP